MLEAAGWKKGADGIREKNGVKLKFSMSTTAGSKAREQAEAIYNQVRGYAVDNAGNLLVCPNCKAKRMERFYKRDRLWYKLFPFLEPAKYKCLQCGMITRHQP